MADLTDRVLLATMAASIASGIEAKTRDSKLRPGLWVYEASDIALRAVCVARAILADIDKPKEP